VLRFPVAATALIFFMSPGFFYHNPATEIHLDPQFPGAGVEIALEIGDDRNLSALIFVKTHGGTNANETSLARRNDR
jgi:hypothetical protein